MTRLAILALTFSLTALPAEARWHFPWNRTADPIANLLDPNAASIVELDPADLQAVVAITTPAIANGAGVKIKAWHNCAVAFLGHPEYLTPSAPPPAAAVPSVAPAGPFSEIVLHLVEVDSAARALQKKVALFSAPLPDDVQLACAAIGPSPGGIISALRSFLHPPVAAAVAGSN